MTDLAVVMLAHQDPPHLRRLISALEGVPIVLHVDAKTPEAVFNEIIGDLPDRVTMVERRAADWASWSLVDAELRALRRALADTSAEHIVVMSGADYPLLPVDGIREELAAWAGRSYIRNVPMPHEPWSSPKYPDGGMRRLNRRYLTRGNRVLFLHGRPLRVPGIRKLPDEVELRASPQWKIYARHHAHSLLQVVSDRPDLVRLWRTTLIPDETFVGSVLASPSLVGDDALRPCAAYPWLLRWDPQVPDHPLWLSDDDFDDLVRARNAPSVTPEEAGAISEDALGERRKFFARKFASTRSRGLLDRVDAELLGR